MGFIPGPAAKDNSAFRCHFSHALNHCFTHRTDHCFRQGNAGLINNYSSTCIGCHAYSDKHTRLRRAKHNRQVYCGLLRCRLLGTSLCCSTILQSTHHRSLRIMGVSTQTSLPQRGSRATHTPTGQRKYQRILYS